MTSQRLRPARHVLRSLTFVALFAAATPGPLFAQSDAQIREDIRFARGVAEEWGFVGSALVLATLCALLLWGLWIAQSSKDGFGAMLAVGLVGTIFWPATINVAMVLGLAPVIGVPLPLFSYGGSAMMSAAIALGLLLNVSMRRYVF